VNDTGRMGHRSLSQTNLNSILDSTSDLIWSVDTRGFRLLGWNLALREHFRQGSDLEVAVGMSPADLFPGRPDYIERWNQFYLRALDQGHFIVEYQVAYGSKVLELSFSLLRHEQEIIGISVFGRDITEHLRAKQELQASEQRFRALFDLSADAVFVSSLDGRVLRANQTACDRLQYSLDELTSLRVLDFQAPGTEEEARERLQRLNKDGKLLTEVTHVARDGTRIPTEVNARIVEIGGQKVILSVARDSSERKRAEVALRESQARYHQLFEKSGTANSVYDLDIRMVLANELYSQLFQVPVTELIGKSVEQIFGEEKGKVLRGRALEVLASRVPMTVSQELSFPVGRKWFQTSYNPLIDEAGNLLGLQVISQDITDLHRANERIQQNEKLESIGVLAGGIAHDFNNLLAGLAGHLELARINLSEGKTAETLVRLEKATQVFTRAKALTKQLLTFSKGGAPVRDLHILGPLLKEWAEFALSGSDASLVLDIPADLWLCECDASQIAQVVDNLLINARQVTPAAGTIQLRAENVYRDGPCLSITVVDQGPGISPDNLERIFDPFFTTKATGTGLGLATSRSIAVQHHGSIEASSQQGRGSSFTLYLPALPGRRTSPTAPMVRDFYHSGRALVMDDEESIRDTLGEILATMGFTVTRARNGHDALSYHQDAQRLGQPFDLALLDLTIPGGMGGLETARRLKKTGSTAVLVAMSGYSEEAGKANLDEEGFGGILFKPFSSKELSNHLSRLFSEKAPFPGEV